MKVGEIPRNRPCELTARDQSKVNQKEQSSKDIEVP